MSAAATSDRRPSHELLMQATEALSQARDAERLAGNKGAAMVINNFVVSLFQIALDDAFDELANRAYDAKFPGGDR